MVPRTMVVAAALLISPFAGAQEDRLAIRAGWYYLGDSDTAIGLRSDAAPIGTSVDFGRDLDVEETADALRIGGYYRFNPRHRIDFEWYSLEREGFRTTTREFTFRDQPVDLNSALDTSLETTVGKLAYTWSFYHTDEIELGFTAGAYVLGYDLQLNGTGGTVAVDESLTAPLPVLGLRLDYTIHPNWHLLFDLETFYLELDNSIRGSLDDFQVALEYRPGAVFFGLGASRLAVDLKAEDDDLRWNVADLNRGVQAYVGVRF